MLIANNGKKALRQCMVSLVWRMVQKYL